MARCDDATPRTAPPPPRPGAPRFGRTARRQLPLAKDRTLQWRRESSLNSRSGCHGAAYDRSRAAARMGARFCTAARATASEGEMELESGQGRLVGTQAQPVADKLLS